MSNKARRDNRVVNRARVVDLGDEVRTVEIMCAGDLHIGDKNRDPHHMRKIREWLDVSKDRYLILVGDLFNAALKTSVSNVYDDVISVDEAQRELTVWLSGIGDRLIASVSGNHDQRVQNAVGADILRMSHELADVPYDGLEAFVTVKLGAYGYKAKANKSPVCYQLYVTHGVGGGRLAGGKVNNLMRLRDIVVADVYVQGHQHDPVCKPAVVWEWDSRKESIVQREQLLVVAPSNMNRGGYAVAKAYSPVSQQIPIITLDGKDKHIGFRWETL